MIQVLLYFLTGAAISLISSIHNTKFQEEHPDARKVPKKAFVIIAVAWPIIVLIWLALIFTTKEKDYPNG